jgi:hypothetical protein
MRSDLNPIGPHIGMFFRHDHCSYRRDIGKSPSKLDSKSQKQRKKPVGPNNFYMKRLSDMRSASVTLKIHVYRSDTKSRERNIGGDVMIHLYLWRATLTFLLCVTPLDKNVRHRSLPTSDTMACVPFPTFDIPGNSQNWDHTPNWPVLLSRKSISHT